MIDSVIYWAGFYHIMQRGRMAEVGWNNNKANVFPWQTDTHSADGCQTNFLLSESGERPKRHSSHKPRHHWALRGNLHVPCYHPRCLVGTYSHGKKSTETEIRFTVRIIVFLQPRHVNTLLTGRHESICFLFIFHFRFTTDVRTVWRCSSFVVRGIAYSATLPSGRATSVCSSSKTRR